MKTVTVTKARAILYKLLDELSNLLNSLLCEPSLANAGPRLSVYLKLTSIPKDYL